MKSVLVPVSGGSTDGPVCETALAAERLFSGPSAIRAHANARVHLWRLRARGAAEFGCPGLVDALRVRGQVTQRFWQHQMQSNPSFLGS
jgi:hypothetical protein